MCCCKPPTEQKVSQQRSTTVDTSKFNCVQPHFHYRRQDRAPERARKPLPLCHTITSAPNTILEGGKRKGGNSSRGCGRNTEYRTTHFEGNNRSTAVEVGQDVVSIAGSAKTIPGEMYWCRQCNIDAPGRDTTGTREATQSTQRWLDADWPKLLLLLL